MLLKLTGQPSESFQRFTAALAVLPMCVLIACQRFLSTTALAAKNLKQFRHHQSNAATENVNRKVQILNVTRCELC